MTEWIDDDRNGARFRVNREAMVSPEVFEQEKQRIFGESWLYLGHDSELPKKNDFRARSVNGKPLIFLRGADGEVRALYNACTHRGTTLCRIGSGNERFLRCFYHGWTFDTSGKLISVPDQESYGPDFDRERNRLTGPRLESYRGFYFVNFKAESEALMTYLGGAVPYLDLVCDQAESGMEILRGSHEYSMRANWKMLVENSVDGYHLVTTHQRYLEMARAAGADFTAMPFTRGADLGGGHVVSESYGGEYGVGRPPSTEGERTKWDAHRQDLESRFGKEWTGRIYGTRNLVIFPNLVIIDLIGGIVVRKIDPIRPDYIEITAWELAPVGEDAELRALRLNNFLTFWGPGGMATPDDVEALECCQRSFATLPAVQWSDLSRGITKDIASGFDEFHIRSFWRRWNELMTGEKSDPEVHDVPEPFTYGRPAVSKG
jgi:benzoate/toluate 1,2-dioxygenase alpha subunit